METRNERISDQLRRAILSAPMNCNQMSERLGIHRATLSRFVNSKRGLPLELIDQIGELLGLRLVVEGTTAATKAKPAKGPSKKQSRPAAGKRKGG